jgi:hypothetical protein
VLKTFLTSTFSLSKGNGQLSHPFLYQCRCSDAMKFLTFIVLIAFESMMTFECSQRNIIGSEKRPSERKKALFRV